MKTFVIMLLLMATSLMAQPFGGEYNYGPGQNLADIVFMTPSNGVFIVGDGSNFVAESGNTARTSLGLGTGDSPVFAGGRYTGAVSGIFPIDPNHLANKKYVDLAVGASFDLFLSDTDDGVVADTHVMFPLETGEAESTEASGTLTQGVDDQLALSWLSEAGVPGTFGLRGGIYDCHLHLNKNSGGATTDVYWTLSFVDENGSSNKTLVTTSELLSDITTSATAYDIHAVVRDEVLTGVTKRLLFELYGNISNGQNVIITATLEGVTDAHITFTLPSSVWQHHGEQLDNINAGDTVTLSGDTVLNGDVRFDGATAGRDALWSRDNDMFFVDENVFLGFGNSPTAPKMKWSYDTTTSTILTEAFHSAAEKVTWNIGTATYG